MDQHKPQGQNPDEWTKPGAKPQGNKKKIPIKPVSQAGNPPSSPAAEAVASGSNGGTTQGNNGQQPTGQSTASSPQCLSIPGIGDRMHHLAMSHSTPNMLMRQSQLVRTKAPEKVRPTSKAECARARGSKNFCDPSHPASCGGRFCGQPMNARRVDDYI